VFTTQCGQWRSSSGCSCDPCLSTGHAPADVEAGCSPDALGPFKATFTNLDSDEPTMPVDRYGKNAAAMKAVVLTATTRAGKALILK
jgi:hypothetical protein